MTPAKQLFKQIPGTTLHSQFVATPPSNVAADWNSYSSLVQQQQQQHNQETSFKHNPVIGRPLMLPSHVNSAENIPVLMKLNQMMMARNEDAGEHETVMPLKANSQDCISSTPRSIERLPEHGYR